ncbi:MAG: SemiSWEET family sugar transporter [Alphaproteobacteria bacterium]|jgi:MtN3 and saliva related transmembrane protein|uniref:SemiSWEET transporter n=1 Tax=Candidatus Scatocola faecipullorum TaxID=2840917 RepID=A0A9D1M2G5_9PROT|nr:SemiSWEET transporter [Azospirillum sp.]HIU52663.1 SemiSWEET transporter [Candidatus Scatocola faecipullorum]
MNPLIAETIGYVGGLCTAFCFMPQTLKTIRTKDVQSLSLVSYILYCIGILSWVLYGFYVHSVQMVVFNSISLFFAGYILIMILKYKKKAAD